MAYILLPYSAIGIMMFFLVLTLNTHDDFLDKILAAIIIGVGWPFVFARATYQHHEDNRMRREILRTGKREILYMYLMGNAPTDVEAEVRWNHGDDFLKDYMKKHFIHGIALINNPSVRRREFALAVEHEVKVPVHEYGFCLGATQWYTRESE